MSEQKNNIKFVSIFQPRDSIQAGIIRDALQQEGINCYVNNENFSTLGLIGAGIGAGIMNVMVPSDQVEQAKEIIAELHIE